MSRPGLSMWGKEGEPMTPQERAAALLERMGLCGHPAASQFVGDIIEHDQQTRRAALLEIRQFCVDYEDCCVLSLVAHANKAVTDASISTMQFIKRHIDDRLAQEG